MGIIRKYTLDLRRVCWKLWIVVNVWFIVVQFQLRKEHFCKLVATSFLQLISCDTQSFFPYDTQCLFRIMPTVYSSYDAHYLFSYDNLPLFPYDTYFIPVWYLLYSRMMTCIYFRMMTTLYSRMVTTHSSYDSHYLYPYDNHCLFRMISTISSSYDTHYLFRMNYYLSRMLTSIYFRMITTYSSYGNHIISLVW